MVQTFEKFLAGEMTGMLLENDNSDLLDMLESQEFLSTKVEEAIQAIHAHQAKEDAQAVDPVSSRLVN